MESSLGKEAIDRLMAEGLDEQDIQAAKLIAERVAFQLREVVQDSAINVIKPSAADETSEEGQKLEAFRAVAEQFDLEDAIRWMVLLYGEFMTYEAVLDEYLLSLQYELQLEDYLNDREQYLKSKEQKRIDMFGQFIVSTSEIEKFVLDTVQKSNTIDRAETATPAESESVAQSELDIPMPDIPSFRTKEVKPTNPTDAIMQELEQLNPNVVIPY